MNIHASVYIYIVLIEILLIVIGLFLFFKLLKKLKEKPINSNEVDEEVINNSEL